MKQIPLLQGKALLIELPKQDFIKAKMQTLVDMRTVWSGKMNFKSGDGWESVSLPPGKWRIIGMLDEVTESEAAELVEKGADNWGDEFGYHDYLGMFHNVRTALESLESAIQAQGWYFENPYGEEEPTIDDPDPHSQYFGSQMDLVVEWNHKQSRVLDRSRCLLLGRRQKEY